MDLICGVISAASKTMIKTVNIFIFRNHGRLTPSKAFEIDWVRYANPALHLTTIQKRCDDCAEANMVEYLDLVTPDLIPGSSMFAFAFVHVVLL